MLRLLLADPPMAYGAEIFCAPLLLCSIFTPLEQTTGSSRRLISFLGQLGGRIGYT